MTNTTNDRTDHRAMGASAVTDEQILDQARPWLGSLTDDLRLNLLEFARALLAAERLDRDGLILDANDVQFLAARLRRLLKFHNYPLPKFADDDKALIGIAPSCIGAVLSNASLKEPGAPDGWKLVPVEPTDEMQAAAAQAIRFDTTLINKLWTGNAVLRAGIAAAPAAPKEK